MAGGGKRVYSFQEVRKHNATKDCWLIISGKVYDVTPFMEEHPGGGEVLLACTGKDATADFDDIGHTESAKEMMPQYCIGEVDAATIPATAKLAYAVRDGTTAASTRVKTTGVWLHLLQLAVPVVLLAATLAFQSFSATKADQ